jgi:hypothetical protein
VFEYILLVYKVQKNNTFGFDDEDEEEEEEEEEEEYKIITYI